VNTNLNLFIFIGVLIFIIIGIFFLFVFTRYFQLWLQCVMSRAGIGFIDLIGMTLRKVNVNTIVRARIMAVQSNIKIETRDLESHYLAGGNVPKLVRALISASRADIPLDFRRASAIDLAGRDLEDAIQTSVNPKMIQVPDPGKGKQMIDAVAKDGIQLRARALVTVRTNIDRLIGGAIGSAHDYKDVMEHPEMISSHVLSTGLDAGTAFEILSIDIADIEVGENVGARLQADQAEADTRRARAQAEIRRAMAVAREQEMIALVQENKAKVVMAEVLVPKAIANAFRDGRIAPPELPASSNGTKPAA
jgi:uncharacterized protein YqfA (UPF0365 family)